MMYQLTYCRESDVERIISSSAPSPPQLQLRAKSVIYPPHLTIQSTDIPGKEFYRKEAHPSNTKYVLA